MVRVFCVLLAVLFLSACGGGNVSTEPEQIPAREVIAEPETDAAGQTAGAPSAEDFPKPEQKKDTEPEQQGTQSAVQTDGVPVSGKSPEADHSEAIHPEKQEAEASNPGTELPPLEESTETTGAESTESSREKSALKITVGGHELLATFEDNSSAEEFQKLLAQGPLTIEMEDYGGFEKVGLLGTSLTRNDTQITTQPGDVILYQGNQIIIYYGTNSWSFTRLARIDDPSGLQEKLGDKTISVTFSLE